MSNYQNFKKSGAFFGGNAPFVEEIYERYAQDPASVDDSWRRFFENVRPDGNIPSYHSLAKNIAARSTERLVNSVADSTDNGKQAAVNRLTSRYRFLGARVATINPLQYDR